MTIKKWVIKDVDVIYDRIEEPILFGDLVLKPPGSRITIYAEDADIKKALWWIFWTLMRNIGKKF